MKEKKKDTRLKPDMKDEPAVNLGTNRCFKCGYPFYSWTPGFQPCVVCRNASYGITDSTILNEPNDPTWYRQESSTDRYRCLSDEITKLRKEIEKLTEEIKNRDTEIIVNELRRQIRELL